MIMSLEELAIIVEGLRTRIKQLNGNIDTINNNIEELTETMNEECSTKAPVITQTVSKTGIVSFTDGADNMPFKSVICYVDAVQSGSGDPSPTNVRPISGWDGVTVTRTGKNLLKLKNGTYTVAGTTAVVSDGTITVTGTSTSGGRTVRLTDPFLLKVGKYKISHEVTDPRITLYINRADDNTAVGSTYNDYLTITEDTEVYAGVNLTNATYTGQSITPQFEIGTTATAYESPDIDSHSLTFPSTVYGGYVDVTEGKLHVTHGIVDLGSLTWLYNDIRFSTNLPISDMTQKDTRLKGICSNYSVFNGIVANAPDKSLIFGSGADTYIYIKDSSYTDTDAFKTAMNGVKVVYELAQETVIDLTPTEIRTLLGQNNLYCNTGDTSAQYPTDTKLYIDTAIASVTPEPEPAPEEEDDEPAPEEEEEEAEPEAVEEVEEVTEEEEPAEEEEEPEPEVKRSTRKKSGGDS